MLNQKLHPPPSDELTIEIDLLYETDPCELKLDEMIEAEPEPEMIEGLPASDALTQPIAILSCSSMCNHPGFLPTVKLSPTARQKSVSDILIRYRKVRNDTATLTCCALLKITSGYRKPGPVNMSPTRKTH